MEVSGDSARRQHEINEWQYSQKMETLFLYQLAFIGFAILVVLAVLTKYGFFNKIFVIYVGVIVFLILFVLWLLRSMYTRNARDKIYWSRRKFSGDGALPSNVPGSVLAASATQVSEMCHAIQSGSTDAICPTTLPNSTGATGSTSRDQGPIRYPSWITGEYTGPTGSGGPTGPINIYRGPTGATGSYSFSRWGLEPFYDISISGWLNSYRDRGASKFNDTK